jgi:hypothetical protein
MVLLIVNNLNIKKSFAIVRVLFLQTISNKAAL